MMVELPFKLPRFRLLAVAVLFGATVLLLIGIALFALSTRTTLYKAQRAIDLNQQVRIKLSLIQQLGMSAESSKRAYLLSGSREDVEAYRLVCERRQRRLAELESLQSRSLDSNASMPLLRARIRAHDEALSGLLSLRSTEGTVPPGAVSGVKLAWDETQTLLDELETDMVGRLASAQTDFKRQLDRATLAMNFGAIVSLILGLSGLALLIAHLREQLRNLQLEREKEGAERVAREKSRFLASMNHEIRTPLNALLGFSELLENEISTSRGQRYLAAIRTSGNSLADLINDILDLSRIESGMLELAPGPVNVREFVRSVETLFSEQARSAQLALELEVNEACPGILVFDGMRVRQILVNFIGNALKFTSEGFVRVKIVALPEEEPGHYEVTFSVIDSGRGIAPAMLAPVFEAFRQAEPSDEMLGGTGLGLSICRELANLMEGTIEVASEIGTGSEFRLILRRIGAMETGGAEVDNPDETVHFNHLPQSRILVVDDNHFNTELIAGFFENSHHRLDFATNGKEALIKMRQSPPDLVLMDIRMPVLNGESTRLHMRDDSSLASIPVIAVTASTLTSHEGRTRHLFDGYLRKPITRSGLFGAMREVLRKRSREPEIVLSIPAADSSPREDHDKLVKILLQMRDEEWPSLSSAMVLSDVVSVAGELRRLALDYDSAPLEQYASALESAAAQFDPVGISRLLNEFHTLIEKLS